MFSQQFILTNGGGLLRMYYLEYMIENPELFIVAEDDQEIVGCCMGYLCENNEFRKNLFLIILYL